jgi:uncharacterized membrane protein
MHLPSILLKTVAVPAATAVGGLTMLCLFHITYQLSINLGLYGFFFGVPLVGLIVSVVVGRLLFRAIDRAFRGRPPQPAAASDLWRSPGSRYSSRRRRPRGRRASGRC